MNTVTTKAGSFTDLTTWRHGHKLVLAVYGATKGFPLEEQTGLAAQIRQAAVAVTSHIAKGFARATAADMARFYVLALGSLSELQNQLIVARDVAYISEVQFMALAEDMAEVQKLLHGLVRAVKHGKGQQLELPRYSTPSYTQY